LIGFASCGAEWDGSCSRENSEPWLFSRASSAADVITVSRVFAPLFSMQITGKFRTKSQRASCWPQRARLVSVPFGDADATPSAGSSIQTTRIETRRVKAEPGRRRDQGPRTVTSSVRTGFVLVRRILETISPLHNPRSNSAKRQVHLPIFFEPSTAHRWRVPRNAPAPNRAAAPMASNAAWSAWMRFVGSVPPNASPRSR